MQCLGLFLDISLNNAISSYGGCLFMGYIIHIRSLFSVSARWFEDIIRLFVK